MAIYGEDSRSRLARNASEWLSFPDYVDLRARTAGVDGLAAYSIERITFTDSVTSGSAQAALVSGNYFKILGITARSKRLIRPDGCIELLRAAFTLLVVISDALWHTYFRGDSGIVGQRIMLGTTRFAIVGVAPPGFTGVHPEGRTDLWIPFTMQSEATRGAYTFDDRENRVAGIIGRLLPGASLSEVQGSLDRAAHDLYASAFPATHRTLALHVARRDRLMAIDRAPDALYSFVLILTMGLLLHFVACSNVASLILARAAERRYEVGIRVCLGASSGQILMLSLTGGAVAGRFRCRRWITDCPLADAIAVSTAVLVSADADTRSTDCRHCRDRFDHHILQPSLLPTPQTTAPRPIGDSQGISGHADRRRARAQFHADTHRASRHFVCPARGLHGRVDLGASGE